MIKKLLLFLFIILLSTNLKAQNKNTLIYGKVLDSISFVKNAHIINLTTKHGTFSKDDGTFEIYAVIGDSLKVSSVQHKTGFVTISGLTIKSKKIEIYLKSLVYQLDEFELKRHNLTGRLGIDQKMVPTDIKDSLLRRTMDFSKVNMKIVEKDDYIDSRVRPPINNVDPTAKFAGAGSSIGIPFKDSERYWALIRELNHKSSFPQKIFSELGETFFFQDLKIPVENYYHFLEYCNPLGIEDLYKNDKLIEIIKILRRESKGYLKIINNK